MSAGSWTTTASTSLAFGATPVGTYTPTGPAGGVLTCSVVVVAGSPATLPGTLSISASSTTTTCVLTGAAPSTASGPTLYNFKVNDGATDIAFSATIAVGEFGG